MSWFLVADAFADHTTCFGVPSVCSMLPSVRRIELPHWSEKTDSHCNMVDRVAFEVVDKLTTTERIQNIGCPKFVAYVPR